MLAFLGRVRGVFRAMGSLVSIHQNPPEAVCKSMLAVPGRGCLQIPFA